MLSNLKITVGGPKFTFCAAHMLSKHEKCSRLHGHNYTVEVELMPKRLTMAKNSMIIDFGIFSDIVKGVCDKFDHRVILPVKDTEYHKLVILNNEAMMVMNEKRYHFPMEDVVLLDDFETTAESLVLYITKEIIAKLILDINSPLCKSNEPFFLTVKLSETEKNSVTCTQSLD